MTTMDYLAIVTSLQKETTKQCIPPHHVSLVNMGTRLMDEDAVSLLMKECGFFPKQHHSWWQ